MEFTLCPPSSTFPLQEHNTICQKSFLTTATASSSSLENDTTCQKSFLATASLSSTLKSRSIETSDSFVENEAPYQKSFLAFTSLPPTPDPIPGPSNSHTSHSTLLELSNDQSISAKALYQKPFLVPSISDSIPGSTLLDQSTSAKVQTSLTLMQKVLKKSDLSWKSAKQQEAMHAVLDLSKDVFVFMPTGSGKTMLAVIPPLLEPQQTTIIVVPLRSLMADYIRRLKEMQIPFERYQTDQENKLGHSANLILVSTEQLHYKHWTQSLGELNLFRPVVRMIFDEAHLVFTADNYRPSLQNLGSKRLFPYQVVLMTGTCPPIAEDHLITAFACAIQPIIIRASSNRPELKYILSKPSSQLEICSQTSYLVKREQSHSLPQDRILIFVSTIHIGKALSNMLHCPFYCGDKAYSDQTRSLAYKTWIEDNNLKVMVCTSAFSAGNDYPHVRLIIHAGTPMEMVDFIQGAGRAGRDGLKATIHILPFSESRNTTSQSITKDLKGKEAIKVWTYHTKTCLRYGLTFFCDGYGITCQDNEANYNCSNCAQFSQHTTPSGSQKRSLQDAFGSSVQLANQRLRQNTTEMDQFIKDMKDTLDIFSGRCSYCVLHGNSTQEWHNIIQCPSMKPSLGHYIDWRKTIKYNLGIHGKICWICHIPQCHDQLHKTFGSNGNRTCDYPDLLLPLIYYIFKNIDKLQDIVELDNQLWSNWDSYTKWLIGPPILNKCTNLCVLFLWFCKKYRYIL